MQYLSGNCINHRQTKKRTTALAILICLLVASLLSGAFILIHADHVHDHHDVGGTCVTCAQIQNAENVLNQLGTATVASFASLAGLYAAVAIIKAICSNIAALTPVTSKTRMNN